MSQENFDVYGDLEIFNVQTTKEYSRLETEIAVLKDQLEKQINENDRLKFSAMEADSKNQDLEGKIKICETNFRMFYDTVHMDLKRKEKMLEESRRQYDDVLFRRRKNMKDKAVQAVTGQRDVECQCDGWMDVQDPAVTSGESRRQRPERTEEKRKERRKSTMDRERSRSRETRDRKHLEKKCDDRKRNGRLSPERAKRPSSPKRRSRSPPRSRSPRRRSRSPPRSRSPSRPSQGHVKRSSSKEKDDDLRKVLNKRRHTEKPQPLPAIVEELPKGPKEMKDKNVVTALKSPRKRISAPRKRKGPQTPDDPHPKRSRIRDRVTLEPKIEPQKQPEPVPQLVRPLEQLWRERMSEVVEESQDESFLEHPNSKVAKNDELEEGELDDSNAGDEQLTRREKELKTFQLEDVNVDSPKPTPRRLPATEMNEVISKILEEKNEDLIKGIEETVGDMECDDRESPKKAERVKKSKESKAPKGSAKDEDEDPISLRTLEEILAPTPPRKEFKSSTQRTPTQQTPTQKRPIIVYVGPNPLEIWPHFDPLTTTSASQKESIVAEPLNVLTAASTSQENREIKSSKTPHKEQTPEEMEFKTPPPILKSTPKVPVPEPEPLSELANLTTPTSARSSEPKQLISQLNESRRSEDSNTSKISSDPTFEYEELEEEVVFTMKRKPRRMRTK